MYSGGKGGGGSDGGNNMGSVVMALQILSYIWWTLILFVWIPLIGVPFVTEVLRLVLAKS